MLIKGEKIRQLREERDCSLAEFAAKAGISISYLSEIERGAKKPSLKTIEKIAVALNIPKSQLVEVSGDSKGVSLGEKLRLLREQKKWTLSEFAQKADVSVSYLSEIERGNVYPAVDTLKRISKALNVSLQDLIGRGGILGSKLKMVREEQGLTQGDLAKQAGVSAGLVGQIEQGKVQPSLQTVEKIAEAVGVSPCYFLIDDAGVEDLLRAMSPELREILNDSKAQSVLRLICSCTPDELKFIFDFIKLYKKHGSQHFKH
ncbi:MAG: helix-turn-helix domain-containing protein [Clostridia bacterium]|jgi:transcriptional regulator with XRE-family HTH domain|nr:helix-turn-helix domain-containing protein [Clostridia bacterium]